MQTAIRRILSVSAIVVSLALSACAEKFVLSGSPDLAGLLVVEPEVKTRSFMGADSQPPVVKVVVRKVVGDLLVEGEPLDGRFVFQGLKPGQYQLVSVYTRPGKKDIEIGVPPESEEQFSFEVQAGVPLYLGVLRVQQDLRMRELGAHFQFVTDAERERAAWRALLKHLSRSSWKPVIERRLESIP